MTAGWASRRLVLIGSGVVAVCSLVSAVSGAPSSAVILMLAAAIAALAVTWGRKALEARSAAALVVAVSAVVVVLSLLDLLTVVTDTDQLADYGGFAGMVARIGCVAGGFAILTGAIRQWGASGGATGEGVVVGSDRLAAIGGVMVVLGWVGMVTSAWSMPSDQAVGVAAATTLVVAVLLHSRGSLPIPAVWRHVVMVCLAVITVGMALRSLIDAVGDWSSLFGTGGLRVLAPYLIYLAGAALVGGAGAMEGLALRRSAAVVGFDHVATLSLVGLVTLLALLTGFGASGDQVPSVEATPATLDTVADSGSVTGETLADRPDVPPLDGCLMLSDEEVEQALGFGESGASGLIRLSGGEGCTWMPDVDGEPAEDLYIAISPGNPAHLQTGVERDGVEGVPVSDVGGLAMWFGSQQSGTLSVIADTDIAYAMFDVEVARPDVDDPARLAAASTLATRAIAYLRGERPQTVEADLCELVTDAEAEELLAPHRVGRAAARDEVTVIGPSSPVDLTEPGDTSCKKLILTEIYVEVAMGDPALLEAEAELEGATAQPIDGVGEEAAWFGNVPTQDGFSAPHEAGVLAVRDGEVQFRLLLSLPDMTGDDQLEAARRLASNVLIRVRSGDATVIQIDHEPPDTLRVDPVDNLLAGEEAGEWTRGEGLVQTLQVMLGEAEPEEITPGGGLLTDEATAIVNMARVHVAEVPDSASAEELRRLLGLLFFSDDQLEEMAGIGAPTASLGWLGSPEAAAETSENCAAFFSGWVIPIGIGSCLEKGTSPTLEESYPGEYKVFGPAPPLPTAGWQKSDYDLAIAAMEEIVPYYKTLGKLPPVNIVFSVLQHPVAAAVAAPHLAGDPETQDRPCGVTLFRNLQDDTDLDVKQYIAHELAHCLHGDTFPGQYTPGVSEWWDEGLADFLSNTVNDTYAKNNLEWRVLPDFDSAELSSDIFGRSYDNFILFQQISHPYGVKGIFDIISTFPAGGDRKAQEDALGKYFGMPDNYHEFVEKVTDIEIVDTGGKTIPNAPDSKAIDLEGRTVILDDPLPFGATRLFLSVPVGKFACIEHDQSGDVFTSWRRGRPGVPEGGWSGDLPDVLIGEAVVVVSATGREGEMSIFVEDVSDDPDCEEESEPEDVECIDLCDPSDYYFFWKSLPDWAQVLLPPP